MSPRHHKRFAQNPGAPQPHVPAEPDALALRWLAAKPLSTHELLARLAQAGCDDVATGAVVDRMRAYRYIDDGRLAEMLSAHAHRAGKGATWLSHTLAARGIDADVAAPIVAEAKARDYASARHLLQRRFVALSSGPEGRRLRLRALRFLAGRGFGAPCAAAAVAALGANDTPDSEPDPALPPDDGHCDA